MWSCLSRLKCYSVAMRFPIAAILLCLSLSLAPGETNPVVHMLVPGFTVQELPVKLSYINNLRFAPEK